MSQVQIVDETPAMFPTVTLCDSNPFTTAYSFALLNSLVKELTLKSINMSVPLRDLGFYRYYLDLEYQLSFYLYSYGTANMMDPSFTKAQRKALGWDLSEYFRECSFNGVKCDFDNDFEWYFSPQYGNCYHFNGVPKGNQVKNTFYFNTHKIK